MTDTNARPSVDAGDEPETAASSRRRPRRRPSTRPTTSLSPPSTRTSCCGCSPKWRIAPAHRARGRRHPRLRHLGLCARYSGCGRQHGARVSALNAELREKADAGVQGAARRRRIDRARAAKVLEKHGVEKFDPLGEKFDPNLHQAMFEMPDPSRPAGTVAQVVQPGYMIGERVLRPALVAIAKGGPKAARDGDAGQRQCRRGLRRSARRRLIPEFPLLRSSSEQRGHRGVYSVGAELSAAGCRRARGESGIGVFPGLGAATPMSPDNRRRRTGAIARRRPRRRQGPWHPR